MADPDFRNGKTFLTLRGVDPLGADDPTPQPPPPRPLGAVDVPPLIGGRYERVGLLGRGGMGSVWRAQDRVLRRPVAVKVVQKGLVRPVVLERFEEEVRITAQLQHPAIIPVHDFGVLDDGRPWFVMQVVRGRTLEAASVGVHHALRLGRETSVHGFTMRRLLEAFLRACEAVAYAHARGVIHRDLKPANIMLGDYGEVFVLDWGLAKVFEQLAAVDETSLDLPLSPLIGRPAVTQQGTITGTPSYMSPEQANGSSDTAGPRCDVHALGASLYDLLCDRPPRIARNVTALIFQVATGRPFDPPSKNAATFRVDDELDRIVVKALSHDPEQRYPDAGGLAADLEAWLDGARKRERAMRLVDEADRALREAEDLDRRATSIRDQSRELGRALARSSPQADKQRVWELEDEARALGRVAEDARGTAIQGLRTALSHSPDLPDAHARLAEAFQEQHRRLEAAGRTDEARAVAVEVAHHDVDGRFATYLQGRGTLTLRTDPPGAEVTLHHVVERHRRWVEEPVAALGPTPLVEVPLEMGRWVLHLEAPGHAPVVYPVWMQRNGRWHGVAPGGSSPTPVRLPRLGELGPDEVYVPAGWFRAGSDRFEHTQPQPPRWVWVDGFVVDRFPVTLRRYLAFLDDLVARGDEAQAMARQPRLDSGEVMLERGADGRFVGVRTDRSGPGWSEVAGNLDLPVFMVDLSDARAYCAWRAERSGLPWRLPMDLEWQKAGRGCDGREYPWGDWFEPTWCHSAGASSPPRPCDVHAYPIDESVFGVRQMAGNCQEWVLGAAEGDRVVPREPDGDRAWICGGFANAGPQVCALTYRAVTPAFIRSVFRTFRSIRTLG